jgi:putative toxin-antitoxin system antitoxin component (TIGR02293 family)
VAKWLDTSQKTLSRRGKEGMLGRSESDLALRYGRTFAHAREALGTDEAARQWLTSAQPALAGAVPTDLLRTDVGAREVERILELIDYGDYI